MSEEKVLLFVCCLSSKKELTQWTKKNTLYRRQEVVTARTCQRWLVKFHLGDFSLKLEHRSGRPSDVSDEVLHKMISLHAEIVEVEIEVVSPSIVPSGNFAELNRTVTCMVLKANDRRTSCPCHDEFRGPRSDYVRQGCGWVFYHCRPSAFPGSWYLFLVRHHIGGYHLPQYNFDTQFSPQREAPEL
ncbi:hypothetical protein TNCV_755251 [Trichonephila clavipes]|nr:hypothetical protein TNCV_755251 [Trichonephila clavipes]